MILIYLISAFLLGGMLFYNKNTIINYLLIVLFILLQWGFTIYEFYHLNITEFEFFKPDALAVLLLGVLSIVCIPAFFHSYKYIKTHDETPRSRAIYFTAMVFFITAIGAAYLANHIAVTWIFVEITTLTASALIYHHRNPNALEGTWKYLFTCAISITFVFIGILFLSLSLQNASEEGLSFETLLKNAAHLNTFWLKLAFIFIFTGFTAKMGLVPMYTAGIDAKDKAPAPAGALFSSVLMNVGFVGIFRTYIVISNTSIHEWANNVILISALLSVFVATIYMSKVKNIKRMFAYSSVEHMGLVMLGIVAGGIGYYAAILHIILHSLVKPALFFQFNQIYRVYKSKSIYNIGDYFKYNLTGAIVLLLGFIFSTAMPPSGLFVSEFLIFQSLFQAHYLPVLIFVLFLLTIIIWSFGKNIFKILFTPVIGFDDSNVVKNSPWDSLSQFVLIAMVLYLGLNPPAKFVNLIHEAIKFLPA